ncbi:guanosine polyphosphate pyrophosphohydrolase [Oribacterium sp. FC2011]|uniref:guanosine polyphosphate pyrophosphohydrolase n=1 Tax=Oribacterium sp. FC2011 TaxID=1408311 RepID=UPI0004E283ED|nr:guanosine polyphosphate pyrophosphohydrolase [Oribacterium sp. FC2011]
MVKLNDYLFNGYTVLEILHNYSADLKKDALLTRNQLDIAHCNFLLELSEILEHNEFLTSESQRIQDFYIYLSEKYPFLSFNLKGRIKSILRAEKKFNGYIVQFIYDYYLEHNEYPPISALKAKVNNFRDLIAYRIVISLPAGNRSEGQDLETEELKYLYEMANVLPEFLEERGFTAELAAMKQHNTSPLMSAAVQPYYRDYIANPRSSGYRSLHITFYDRISRNFTEVQLRTKDMDDYAEIGTANHYFYEKKQENPLVQRNTIPVGENLYFDEAYNRIIELRNLDLSKVNVNMFSALDNRTMNDGCGLYKGRLILPYEHLAKIRGPL